MRVQSKIVFLVLNLGLGLASLSRGGDLAIGPSGKDGYQGWQATGTAFRLGPAGGDWLPKLGIDNAGTNPVISSEMEGDQPTGSLTSPTFRIQRKYLSYRIGGGDYEGQTCLNLLVNGQVVRSATGWRSDRLAPESWDVSEFHGQKAQVQVVDQAAGDWGHINVSQLLQTDAPERLPVDTGRLYQEALRPQFHFTARQWGMNRLNPSRQQEGWVNDLNGLIYYDGEYHLFAQRWAKCWIHAVSRDLVHWTELPPAFWEEQPGSGVQSGTCVVDYHNTSGLAPDPAHPAMIAFFPRWDNQVQCIAYSLDHGRHWKFHEKNPVLVHPERDPKIFWYAPGNHWVMMLYGNDSYHILTSTNLLNWADEHHPIKNSFECPDFFELPVDGQPNQMKWVLIQGNGNYSIGTFDGVEFKEETGRRPCDVGPNFYATESWANTETGDGRRIQTAWMRGSDFPDMPFNQQISFPCELTLHRTPGGLRIFREPVRELATLHRDADTWTHRVLRANETLPLEPAGQLFQIQATVSLPKGTKLIFDINGNSVVLTATSLESGGQTVPTESEVRYVEILVDRGSIETFLNHGELSSTRFALPNASGLSLRSENGPATIESLSVYTLNSAWATGSPNTL
jgi:sucrose-6-phosphate hydrolase SacC (GH32 family)